MTRAPFAPEAQSLFSRSGQRKYLCSRERDRFRKAIDGADRPTRLLALVLLHTGCRISEALETTPRRLDGDTRAIVFRTLKRRRLIYRAVPLPVWLSRELAAYARTIDGDAPLWPCCRQTAWRRIVALMRAAGVTGPMACPRGLRHGYGIHAAGVSVPGNLVQRWMGHASPDTTAIYLDAVGSEEREFARRMW